MLVEVSGHRFNFPPVCACCGDPAQMSMTVHANRSSGVRVVRYESRSWSFPYCNRCGWHVHEHAQLPGPHHMGCGTLCLCLLTCGIWLLVHLRQSEAADASRLAAEARVRSMMRQTCAAPWCAVGYVGWHGPVHRFTFESEAYALDFMRANRSKLLNVPWELLPYLDGS